MNKVRRAVPVYAMPDSQPRLPPAEGAYETYLVDSFLLFSSQGLY